MAETVGNREVAAMAESLVMAAVIRSKQGSQHNQRTERTCVPSRWCGTGTNLRTAVAGMPAEQAVEGRMAKAVAAKERAEVAMAVVAAESVAMAVVVMGVGWEEEAMEG